MIFPVAELNKAELKKQADILNANIKELLKVDASLVIVPWCEIAKGTIFAGLDDGKRGFILINEKGEKACGQYTFYEDC